MASKVEQAYLTPTEIATFFNVTKKTIKRWDEAGKFPNAIGEGRERRYAKVDIENFDKSKPLAKEASSSESLEVSKATEAAQIADQRDKQVESEIKTKLREQGYQSIEEGLKDVKSKMEEANQHLETARQQEQSINDQLEAIEQEKQKVTNAYAIVKEREATIDARLEEAIRLENGQKELTTKSEILRQEVQAVIDYHNANIVPCVKALRKSVKTIYTLWTVLENSKGYDKETLSEYIVNGLNFIGRKTNVLDRYLENVKGTEVQMPSTTLEDNADGTS